MAAERVVKGVISKAFCREMSCDDKSYRQNFKHPSKLLQSLSPPAFLLRVRQYRRVNVAPTSDVRAST